MSAQPDSTVYAEQLAWARAAMIRHLPPNDPWRMALVLRVDVEGAAWKMLVDEWPGGWRVARHPPEGPVVHYPPLERAYQVPFDEPERVVIAELSDASGEDGEPLLDVAAVYIRGESMATMIDERPPDE